MKENTWGSPRARLCPPGRWTGAVEAQLGPSLKSDVVFIEMIAIPQDEQMWGVRSGSTSHSKTILTAPPRPPSSAKTQSNEASAWTPAQGGAEGRESGSEVTWSLVTVKAACWKQGRSRVGSREGAPGGRRQRRGTLAPGLECAVLGLP